jgi:hypothetical protein
MLPHRRQFQKMLVCNRTLLGGDSLPEREWNHANNHRYKQKQVKGASKKMRFHRGSNLLFHWVTS